MSTPTMNPPAVSNGHGPHASGVHTYRGRNLQELIPRIRSELGPDAIILREREGLMGGVSGFFAHRFVEVEARAGTPRIDVYDDHDEYEEPRVRVPPLARTRPPPIPAAPWERIADTPVAPIADTPPAPIAETPPPALASATGPFGAPQPPPYPPIVHTPPPPVAEAPEPPPNPTFAAALEHASAEPVQTPSVPPMAPAPAPEPAQSAAARPEPRQPAVARPQPAQPAAPRRSRSRSRRWASSFATKRQQASARQEAVPPKQLEPDIAGPIAHELIAQGISQEFAHELIAQAAAHGALFGESGLRDAVRATLAAQIPAAVPLPAAGAAIAFVGTGGAGKTRCAAALAAAYGQASKLSVSAVAMGAADGGRELSELLRVHGVAVTAMPDEGQLVKRRAGGLVVVDTEAVISSDDASVAALAVRLEPMALDALCIVLPATIALRTGRMLLANLESLRPTAIALTHVDETDELGIAVELTWATGIPIAYIHEGLAMPGALSAGNPSKLAARLLP